MDILNLFKLGNSGKTVEIPTEKRNSNISFAQFEAEAIAFAEEMAGDGVDETVITLFILNITGGNARKGDKSWSINGLLPYWRETSEDGLMPEMEFVLLPKGSKYTAVNGMKDGEVLVSVGEHILSMYYSKIDWAPEGKLRSDVVLIRTAVNGVQQRCIESFAIAKPLPSTNGTSRTAADRRAQFEMMRKKLLNIVQDVELEEEFK